ncbi:Zinc transporter 1 [Nymphaea thermarum]|nr:Zinc transporter 1 [Nymphaea thermarum]
MERWSRSHCKLLIFLLLMLLRPLNIALAISKEDDGEHSCGPSKSGNCRDSDAAFKLKMASMAAILVAGGIGACLPIVGKSVRAFHPESDAFFMIKAFAAGVILGVGCMHVLPDAFGSLGSPCLKDGNSWAADFPLAGFILMASIVGTLMVDTLATGYFKRSELSKAKPVGEEQDIEGNKLQPAATSASGHDINHAHTHTSHGHAHGSVMDSHDDASRLLRHRVLELGIVVHSVIIGTSLGTSTSPCIIRPLMAALSFHQFFEGIGLSGCILQAKFKNGATAMMTIFFSLTTPIGIGIGTGISSVYEGESPTALLVQGVLNSASAGILIYMALVDLLAADIMHPRMQGSAKLQLLCSFFLLLGVTSMSILAKWA